MPIALDAIILRMAAAPGAIAHLIGGVSDADARWKPPDGAWSILEILTHLADEEVEDFRTRVRLTLDDPTTEWPPIDPEGWAGARAYNEGELNRAMRRFADSRAESVSWLRTLESPDWSRARTHPRLGTLRAGDLMASWAAHDALHLRQIAKRLYQLADRDTGEFDTAYAGRW